MREMAWANEFISEDYMSAFERCREYLYKIMNKMDKKQRLKHLFRVWDDNHKKGYLTEMEATAMLNLARDWDVHNELIARVREG